MRLVLVRHPKPKCEAGLCYGRLDLDCEEDALEAAALRLHGFARGHRVVASPARRAAALAARLSEDVFIEPRLQELHFGEWEGPALAGFGPRGHRFLAKRPAGLCTAGWRDAVRDG